MPALHVRNVSEPVLAALKERAARHDRSVQEEVRLILAAAAAEPKEAQRARPLQLTTVRTGATQVWSREEMYDDTGR